MSSPPASPSASLLAAGPSTAIGGDAFGHARPAPARAAATAECFHCGRPVSEAEPLWADINGTRHAFCCGGCQTLAQTLHAAGFAHLYGDQARFARPIDDDARREAEPIWAAYDSPELRSQFVRPLDGSRAEITLAPENIRCAACAWLIEQHLSRQHGVESVVANVATRRVVVRWREGEQSVSGLLAALAGIGYVAWPFEVSRSDQQDRRARQPADAHGGRHARHDAGDDVCVADLHP